MIKITKEQYKGKVYDLIFDELDYYYANTENREKFIEVHNCDIDWDSELGGRDKVLEYLIHKYGQESVCNVVTFGTFGAKSAVKDISRGLNKPTGMHTVLEKKIAKLEGLEDAKDLITFFKNVKTTNEDVEIINWINTNEDTIRLAHKLVGQMKNLGTHAGGIVVTPKPIYNFIPVTKGTGNLVTAFSEADGSEKQLSELGILKLDVLGLQTLNILKGCVTQIKADKGIDLAEYINYLPMHDDEMIKSFCKGDNYGIFQMERSKMFIDAFASAKGPVDSFEDIVAINAMNRPGPLEKYIKKYGYWKAIDKGIIEVDEDELEKVNKERYPFPFMKNMLGKTYGTVLYQEQIMSLVCELTGMSFGESDVFRRSIAWKEDHPKYYTVAPLFESVKQGMYDKGYSEKDAEYFLQYLRDVSGYSFNKSHSVAYAYVAWQCLYFKTYYPVYFYTSLLNQTSETDEIKQIITFAKEQGLEVKGIAIHKSKYESTVEDDNTIRLGYKLMKGLGNAASAELKTLKLNECNNIHEVLQKPFKKINTTVLGNLIDLGCFDELEPNRDVVRKLLELYKEEKIEKWFTRKRSPGELKTMPKILIDEFGEFETFEVSQRVMFNSRNPHFDLVKELSVKYNHYTFDKDQIERQTIEKEVELLGFKLTMDKDFIKFISGAKNKGFRTITEALEDAEDGVIIKTYFAIEGFEVAMTKTNKPFLRLMLNDSLKNYKVTMWINGDVDGKIKKYKAAKFGIGNLKKNDFGYNLLTLEVPEV